MKKIVHQPGGRLYKGEDFLAMQQLTLDLTEKFFAQYGNCILYGCEAVPSEHGGALSPGVIIIDGEACAFAGVESSPRTFYIEKIAVTENVPYKTGDGVGYITHIAQRCSSESADAILFRTLPRFVNFDKGGEYVEYYSFDEIPTNQYWVNSFRIYKKTFRLTDFSQVNTSTPHGVHNLDSVVKFEFVWYDPQTNTYSAIPDNIRVTCNQTALTIYFANIVPTGECYVTVYYTKDDE
jgi:hypothetical protein